MIIVNGAVITVDVNTTVGSKASAVGVGVTINGASTSSYGTLQVASGIAFTIRGYDNASNAMMKINRYGLFAPQAGSTVLGDVPSDFGTCIINQGRFEAIGNSGSHITFSVPAANINWAVSSASEVHASAGWYESTKSLATVILNFAGVSNAAHTGKGSLGDSSFSTASTGYTTEVAYTDPPPALTSGQYCIDYDSGIVYVYSTTGTAPLTASYYHLDKTTAGWKGWGIVSGSMLSSNTCLIDYCDFVGMGGTQSGGSVTLGVAKMTAPVGLYGHQTTGVASDSSWLAYVKHSTFNQCNHAVQLNTCQGKNDGTDQFLVTNNTINEASGGTFWSAGIGFYNTWNAYVTIDSNVFSTRGQAVDLGSGGSVSSLTTYKDMPGVRVTNNTGVAPWDSWPPR